MSGLPPWSATPVAGPPARLRLHDFDRPAPFSRLESQTDINDPQEVTGEAAAGRTVGRHGLGDQEPWAIWRGLCQRVEHPPEEQGRLLARDVLIEEMRQGVQEDHEPDRMGCKHGRQAFTEQRGELPAREGADQMDLPQEHLRRDAAGLGHRHQGPELKGHVGIDDGHVGAGGEHPCGGVEGDGVHPMVPPQQHRARLKYSKRARQLEWEHVVPAEAFGQSFPEWRDGHPDCVHRKGKAFKGRNCAAKMAVPFRYMEADLYNLQPAIGEVNQLRSNYSMAMIEGETRRFGSCDVEIEDRKIEPRPDIRGDIARTYYYMDAAYPGRGVISEKNRKLFEAWDTEDLVDAWKRERVRRIEQLQGNTNPFVK